MPESREAAFEKRRSVHGSGNAKVIASVGHDTASAVAGIPGFGVGQVYISIGTNINMGIELTENVTSEKRIGAVIKCRSHGRQKHTLSGFFRLLAAE